MCRGRIDFRVSRLHRRTHRVVKLLPEIERQIALLDSAARADRHSVCAKTHIDMRIGPRESDPFGSTLIRWARPSPLLLPFGDDR